MKYTPKQAPEGINTSKEHPIKELILLLSATVAIVAAVVYLIVLSSDYLVKYIPVSMEERLFSSSEISGFKKAAPSADLAKVEEYMNGLVQNLQAAHGDTEYKFKVHILNNPGPNAFAFPGGNIGITTGLLKLIQTENGLAMVIGHEMGHHYARDPIKGVGRGVVLALVLYAVTGFGSDDWVQGMISDMSSLTFLSFSRDQERAADNMGKTLLKQYYGHTAGATEFFEKLKASDKYKNTSPEFLNSHPDTEERIQTMGNEQDKDHKRKSFPDDIASAISRIELPN